MNEMNILVDYGAAIRLPVERELSLPGIRDGTTFGLREAHELSEPSAADYSVRFARAMSHRRIPKTGH